MREKQRQPLITPLGKFACPRLTTPDKKFSERGVYSVRLILDAVIAEPLVRQIDAAIQESVAQTKKGNPKVKRINLADRPYKRVLNDKEEETGEIAFNFRMMASGVSKETKQPWECRPAIFDAKCNPLTDVEVGAGTEGKVAFTILPFYTALTGAGVSLRLEAVQIIKLVEPSGKRTAADYGLAEEEGYDSSAAPAKHDDESTGDGNDEQEF